MAKQCQFHHIVAKYSCSQMLKTYCPDESFDPPFLPAASGMVFQSFMSSSIVFLFYSHFSSLTFQPLTLIFQFEPKIKLQNIQKHFKLPLSDYWSHYHCMGSWLLLTKLPCIGTTDPCTIHSMKGRSKQKALLRRVDNGWNQIEPKTILLLREECSTFRSAQLLLPN